MTVDITTLPLTADEEVRLHHLEETISSGLDTFVEVGTALAEVRNSKLYRATHATFSRYLDDRWEISESRGYQLIGAARVSTIVEGLGLPAPTREAHARELAGLPEHQVVETWQRAVSTQAKPTAATVREARLQVVQQPAQPRRKPLSDAVGMMVRDLNKRAATLERLTRDDRWTTNFGRANRGELQRTIELLQRVQQALDPAGGTQILDLTSTTMSRVENEVLNTDNAPITTAATTTKVGYKPTVVIEVGPNTATVLDGPVPRSIVRAAIEMLGIPTMPDKSRAKLVTFGARHADDLQAALEDRGIRSELRSVTP